ncbi:MAG: hypothetical protein D3922_03655 [Candidatus Electrothrix sp. AR1]|nr:hypothetical protein [Candidatus Electrothrix sp. AR1]
MQISYAVVNISSLIVASRCGNLKKYIKKKKLPAHRSHQEERKHALSATAEPGRSRQESFVNTI